MNSFFIALQFLTLFRFKKDLSFSDSELKKSVFFFPIIGLLLGLILFFITETILNYSPLSLQAVILVGLLALLSGGLHLDGLSDCADALLSSRSKKRMLEIMKDSHAGSMAVIVLWIFLSLKAVAFYEILCNNLNLIILIPIVSRTLVCIPLDRLPYIREEGLGKAMWNYPSHQYIWKIVSLLLFSLIFYNQLFFWPFFITTTVIWLFCIHVKNTLGGGTGDVSGATIEIAETLFAISLCF